MAKQRVVAYIDGFNLFYSSLKGTKYKWLDIWSMCQALLQPCQELITIKYYSAIVSLFTGDQSRTDRQRFYLEALQINPKIEVKLGYFSTHRVKMPMAVDAVRDEFDYAMLFSNDSDMAYAVQETG